MRQKKKARNPRNPHTSQESQESLRRDKPRHRACQSTSLAEEPVNGVRLIGTHSARQNCMGVHGVCGQTTELCGSSLPRRNLRLPGLCKLHIHFPCFCCEESAGLHGDLRLPLTPVSSEFRDFPVRCHVSWLHRETTPQETRPTRARHHRSRTTKFCCSLTKQKHRVMTISQPQMWTRRSSSLPFHQASKHPQPSTPNPSCTAQFDPL